MKGLLIQFADKQTSSFGDTKTSTLKATSLFTKTSTNQLVGFTTVSTSDTIYTLSVIQQYMTCVTKQEQEEIDNLIFFLDPQQQFRI